jgi:hypothetical protein
MIPNSITSSVAASTADVWAKAMWLIPNLIIAILVVLVGWMIAVMLGKIAEKILNKLHINTAAKEIGLVKALSEVHLGGDIAGFIGGTIKWFFAIVFFLAAADIFGLDQLTNFLNRVLLYIPNIIAAVLIVAVGIWLANILNRIIHKSARVSGFMSPDMLGKIAEWTVLILAIFAALDQLGIAQQLIQTIITGIVIMLALAGGLAFGLGGKDKAKQILDNMGKQ